MTQLTFTKAGRETLVLTDDDLLDFEFERSCFSGEKFELGGVNAKSIYMLINNREHKYPRGTFADTRIKLEIDGKFCGNYNAELPKRRNGTIELKAYDDMLKFDVPYPEDYEFPQTFWSVYAQCIVQAGLADSISFDNFVLNALFNNGVISHEYTDYIYANSCRQLISGMAEWNGGFAYINDDNKLQVDLFSKEVTHTFYSGDLFDFEYSDETIAFSKIRSSQKNKTYEMGDDSGYTLVINNQYISYGLTDENFESYFKYIYDYYKGFSLTPMSFTLAEPDFSLKLGDRISVYDEEEQVTVTGNISKIAVTGNCSMTVTCGGFDSTQSGTNYKTSSSSQINQAKTEAKGDGTAQLLRTGESRLYVATFPPSDSAPAQVIIGDSRYGTERPGQTGPNVLVLKFSGDDKFSGTETALDIQVCQLGGSACNIHLANGEFEVECLNGVKLSLSNTDGIALETNGQGFARVNKNEVWLDPQNGYGGLRLTAGGLTANGKKVLTED